MHVEKLVRKYRWTQRRDAAKESQHLHEHRDAWWFYDMDGKFVLNARLPPEIGAVVRKALEVARGAVRKPREVSAETSLQIPAKARDADAFRYIAELFLAHHGEDIGAGASADRVQVVVHVDQAILPESHSAKENEPHRCELEDGPALALDTVRRLACDAGRSSAFSRARTATRSTLAARRAPFRSRSHELCALATAAVGFPGAIARASAMATT